MDEGTVKSTPPTTPRRAAANEWRRVLDEPVGSPADSDRASPVVLGEAGGRAEAGAGGDNGPVFGADLNATMDSVAVSGKSPTTWNRSTLRHAPRLMGRR